MGNSEIWYKQTATGNETSIVLDTITTIPTNTSITVTVYEDVNDDNTGSGSVTDPSGTTHNYDNTNSVVLSGGDEVNTLTGFDGNNTVNAYIIQVELDGDGADPTLDSPQLDELEIAFA